MGSAAGVLPPTGPAGSRPCTAAGPLSRRPHGPGPEPGLPGPRPPGFHYPDRLGVLVGPVTVQIAAVRAGALPRAQLYHEVAQDRVRRRPDDAQDPRQHLVAAEVDRARI